MQYMLIGIISWGEQIIEILIIARVLVSWLGQNQFNPLIQYLYRLTDPILKPFQEIVRPEKLGGLDISPIIALFVIQLVAKFLTQILITL